MTVSTPPDPDEPPKPTPVSLGPVPAPPPPSSPAPHPGAPTGHSVSWPQVALAGVSAVLTMGMGMLTIRTNNNANRIDNAVTITREQLEEARERREENEARSHKNEVRIIELEKRADSLGHELQMLQLKAEKLKEMP